MTKHGDIYINKIPLNKCEGWDTFNVFFLKIGDMLKVGVSPAVGSSHDKIMEQLLQSEKIFCIQNQTGKNGKKIPKAEFYDEASKRHGKALACGYMTINYETQNIRFYGCSPEYGMGMKLLEVKQFMDNYYPDSEFNYSVES
jgi:hypothetical protein